MIEFKTLTSVASEDGNPIVRCDGIRPRNAHVAEANVAVLSRTCLYFSVARG
jgi:hypothetical protein